MPGKHNAGGCGCCGCTDPPSCTLTGTGTGVPNTTVNLTWTTSGADTVEIRDEDNTLISTNSSGTSVAVANGSCKTYTLTATNACGETTCEYTNMCPDTSCGFCDIGTSETSYTVQFTYNGVLSACACDSTTTATRCSQFSGSFTVTDTATECLWTGGPFGSTVFCGISRGAWTLRLRLQWGDANGGDSSNVYAILTLSYAVVDPPACIEFASFQKVVGSSSVIDCSTIPGTYSLASVSGRTSMCNLGVVIS